MVRAAGSPRGLSTGAPPSVQLYQKQSEHRLLSDSCAHTQTGWGSLGGRGGQSALVRRQQLLCNFPGTLVPRSSAHLPSDEAVAQLTGLQTVLGPRPKGRVR